VTQEAFMFAGHHRLHKLHVIIDDNGFQALGRTKLILDPHIGTVLPQLGWEVYCVDGHDIGKLTDAFQFVFRGSPVAIIAKTLKGHGVKYMEDSNEYHYKVPLDEPVC
jgi:transketolase